LTAKNVGDARVEDRISCMRWVADCALLGEIEIDRLGGTRPSVYDIWDFQGRGTIVLTRRSALRLPRIRYRAIGGDIANLFFNGMVRRVEHDSEESAVRVGE
jgi:hypothetical protein